MKITFNGGIDAMYFVSKTLNRLIDDAKVKKINLNQNTYFGNIEWAIVLKSSYCCIEETNII